ncbi:MAG: hypothetical protein EP338_09055 [Bacteroidetes bacterium]|nr:MAG: hypothetical protein EP338_09055 [Bacteroidota bacterium]
MKSTSCKLATKIQGKYYWIKGTDIDDHGDAHGPEGFCNHVLYADLSGHLVQSDILFVEKFNLK